MLLNNINLSELQSVYLLEKYKLPNCAAIYFVSDSKGQVLYIGRTVNLVDRWRDHHRFNQLKRLNLKNRISISWLSCSNDI
jgi:excinuclease UvrABC nuclease subunit